jgi:hypothetical protein
MNQKEVVHTLSLEAKIEPSFTQLGNIILSKVFSSLLAMRSQDRYHNSFIVGWMAENHGTFWFAQAHRK